jgi:S-adenosylmethionine hydrolase
MLGAMAGTPPVIALLTDFGTRDHYVGAMKGVILGIAREAVLVDLTHEIPAHDILQGALQLAGACACFPAGTIFLSVVDPGVGTARRAIAVEAGDYRFVGPDNGLMTAVLRDLPPRRITELTARQYARPDVSRTFEGRDRFAPAAAWLAAGVEMSALGRPVSDYQRLEIPVPVVETDCVLGQVLYVDRFGNAVTNVDRGTLDPFVRRGPPTIFVQGHTVGRLVETYGEIAGGEICALVGSTGHLEIAAQSASAAERWGINPGTEIQIARG